MPEVEFPSVSESATVDYNVPSLTMPDKDLNLLLEAGHEVTEAADLRVSSLTMPDSADYWETFNVESEITNDESEGNVYVRLIDKTNGYIVNQTEIYMNSGETKTVTFSDVNMSCEPKDLTVECGRINE